jgi:signal peptidase I
MLYRPVQDSDNRILKTRWLPMVKGWIKPLLTAAIVVAVINLFFPRYYVEGKSMEPQLHEADRLLVSNVDAMTHAIERGKVVVLSSPVDGTIVVKRVIGLPGETVDIRAGLVFVDNNLLSEDYIDEAPNYTGHWYLTGNQYFVLGDNRNHSFDSGDYGPVERELLHGVVKLRWWPPNAIGGFYVPHYEDLTNGG